MASLEWTTADFLPFFLSPCVRTADEFDRSRDVEYELERYGRLRDFHMRSGYAFVTFESSRDAEECVRDLDGRRFDGSRLIVEFARDRDGSEALIRVVGEPG
jgi:RNA recognition motif-containing protein